MTIKYWLQTIKHPVIRKQAIRNMYTCYCKMTRVATKNYVVSKYYILESTSLANALQYAFDWSLTKEGYYYWNNIFMNDL